MPNRVQDRFRPRRAYVIDLSWSILSVLPPSLLLFVALPVLLRVGVGFWPALLVACLATVAAYGIWITAGRRLGVNL
jgi:Na+/melibiose symporter-like transporter